MYAIMTIIWSYIVLIFRFVADLENLFNTFTVDEELP